MNEVKKKCSYHNLQTDWNCPYEALEDSNEGFCIFHERRKDKDIEKFNEGINKLLEDKDSDAYHFEGFYFPSSIHFGMFEVKKSVYFCHAEFKGETTVFFGTIFSGHETDFTGVEFSAENTVFLGTKFVSEYTRFLSAKFTGKKVQFLHSKFYKNAEFIDTIFEARTTFIGVNLTNCAIIGVDLKNVDFSLLEWDWKSKLKKEPRGMGSDLTLKIDETYRQLKVQFHTKRDFAKAGMFHFREQECKRKAFKPFSRNFFNWVLLWVLKLSCGYGEKLRNVLITSISLVFLFAIGYMFLGLYNADNELVFNYDLRFKNIAPILTILKDFGTSLVFSVKGFFPLWRFQQYKVVGDFANLVAGFEFLLGAFMIGLFIYVFRRRMDK